LLSPAHHPGGLAMQSPSHTHSTMTRPQTSVQTPALRVKTHVKAGGLAVNHNETLVRGPRPTARLKVKTHVKAGGTMNHNETLVRTARPAASLQVKMQVKSGSIIVHD
jgi:hypothetical protein